MNPWPWIACLTAVFIVGIGALALGAYFQEAEYAATRAQWGFDQGDNE